MNSLLIFLYLIVNSYSLIRYLYAWETLQTEEYVGILGYNLYYKEGQSGPPYNGSWSVITRGGVSSEQSPLVLNVEDMVLLDGGPVQPISTMYMDLVISCTTTYICVTYFKLNEESPYSNELNVYKAEIATQVTVTDELEGTLSIEWNALDDTISTRGELSQLRIFYNNGGFEGPWTGLAIEAQEGPSPIVIEWDGSIAQTYRLHFPPESAYDTFSIRIQQTCSPETVDFEDPVSPPVTARNTGEGYACQWTASEWQLCAGVCPQQDGTHKRDVWCETIDTHIKVSDFMCMDEKIPWLEICPRDCSWLPTGCGHCNDTCDLGYHTCYDSYCVTTGPDLEEPITVPDTQCYTPEPTTPVVKRCNEGDGGIDCGGNPNGKNDNDTVIIIISGSIVGTIILGALGFVFYRKKALSSKLGKYWSSKKTGFSTSASTIGETRSTSDINSVIKSTTSSVKSSRKKETRDKSKSRSPKRSPRSNSPKRSPRSEKDKGTNRSAYNSEKERRRKSPSPHKKRGERSPRRSPRK